MRAADANAHEIATCVLEIAGLRELGRRLDIEDVLDVSYDGMRTVRGLTLLSREDVKHAIQTQRPKRDHVRSFVGLYEAFARLA